jgi:hypothetical protein
MPHRGRRVANERAEALDREETLGRDGTQIIRPKEKQKDQVLSDYIRYFKRVMKVNNWTDSQAGEVFAVMLGPDDRSLDSIEGKWTGFSELEQMLVEQEKPMREAYLAELMTATKLKNENPEDLRNKIVRLVATCYPHFPQEFQSQIARDYFLHALPENVRMMVLSGKSDSLEDTVNLAKTSLLLQKGEQNEHLIATVKETSQNYVRKRTEQNNNYQKRRIRCFRCQGFGHLQRVCPTYPYRSAVVNYSGSRENLNEKNWQGEENQESEQGNF